MKDVNQDILNKIGKYLEEHDTKEIYKNKVIRTIEECLSFMQGNFNREETNFYNLGKSLWQKDASDLELDVLYNNIIGRKRGLSSVKEVIQYHKVEALAMFACSYTRWSPEDDERPYALEYFDFKAQKAGLHAEIIRKVLLKNFADI